MKYLKKQKDFIKLIGVLFVLLFLITNVSSATIDVVPGDGDNTNPPADVTPTVDYIECPDGYSCIRDTDYSQFISGLKDFTKEIGERTQFIEDVFDRFDTKISLDEDFLNAMTEIVEDAQLQRDRALDQLDESKRDHSADVTVLTQRVNNLDIQVAELKATDVLRFIVILLLAIALAELINRVRIHGRHLWQMFVAWFPWKIR